MKIIILAALLIVASPANSYTFAECNSFASQLNAGYPARVNATTSVESVGCERAARKLVFSYMMRWDFTKVQFDPAQFKTLRPSTINHWCTTPGMRDLMRSFDVRYDYYDNAGVYVISDLYRIEDCL